VKDVGNSLKDVVTDVKRLIFELKDVDLKEKSFEYLNIIIFFVATSDMNNRIFCV
jgi:hypothetical protein